jgi:hypothetical protein
MSAPPARALAVKQCPDPDARDILANDWKAPANLTPHRGHMACLADFQTYLVI